MSIDAVDRTVAILEHLAQEPDGLGVMRLADRVGLAPSTLHRYLASLREHGLVDRTDDRSYALTPRLYILGLSAAHGFDLEANARSSLRRLADASGETVCLMVRDGDHSVCIEQIESGHQLRIEARIGSRSDLRLGSTGRVLLAFTPTEVQDEVLARKPLRGRTPNTITDPEQIRSLLEAIRRDGFFVSRSQVDDGVMAVAAPVRDRSEEVIAAVAIVAPESRMAAEPVLSGTIRLVLDEANVLSQRLGNARAPSASSERRTS
ncbi:MAG: IclR family transcriptional regulator [Acidimicrobiia bacterium]